MLDEGSEKSAGQVEATLVKAHITGRAAGALRVKPGERPQPRKAGSLRLLIEGCGRERTGAGGQTERPAGPRPGEERDTRAQKRAVLGVGIGPCAHPEQESRAERDLVLDEDGRHGEGIAKP